MTDKPKIDRSKYIFENQDGQTCIKQYGDVKGCGFKIRKNKNCTIYILDISSEIYVDDCIDCKIITGPITSSIFIRTCKNCTVSTIAMQVRMRACENVKVFTYCPTDPAVESSFDIAFAPYNVFFPYLKELFRTGKFNETERNHITTPYDFTSAEVLGGGARHFFQLPEEEFYIEEVNEGSGLPCEEMYDGYSEQEPFVCNKRGTTVYSGQSNIEGGKQDNFFEMNDNYNNDPFQSQNIPMTNNPIQGMDMMGNRDGGFEFSSNLPLSVPIDRDNVQDEEEQKREMQRQVESNERARKIREKIDTELKMKNELREKAMEYLNTAHAARLKKIEDNKKTNQFNEKQMQAEKEELKSLEGNNVNQWERLIGLVDIKASDYKGTKDVTRMRQCIINRKGDFNKNTK